MELNESSLKPCAQVLNPKFTIGVVMLTFYTGQIMASRHIEQKKKGSQIASIYTEVNVMFSGFDVNGETVMQMDAIRVGEEYNDLFKANIGKFVAIPYTFLQTPNGSYMFPSSDMQPIIFDQNPTQYQNPMGQSKKSA